MAEHGLPGLPPIGTDSTPEEIARVFATGGSVTSSDDVFNERIQSIKKQTLSPEGLQGQLDAGVEVAPRLLDPNIVEFEGKFIHKDLAAFAEESRAAVANFDLDELEIVKDQFGFKTDEAAAGFLTRGLGIRSLDGLPSLPSILDQRFGPAGAVGQPSSTGSLLGADVDTAGQPLATVEQVEAAGGIDTLLQASDSPEDFQEAAEQIAVTYGAQVELSRTIDGDTADFVFPNGATQRVRFIGIDTAELGSLNDSDFIKAIEAKIFTNNILNDAELIEAVRDVSERDQFGRLLRDVLVDGTNIGVHLIEAGLANRVVFPPDLQAQPEFKLAEARFALGQQLLPQAEEEINAP